MVDGSAAPYADLHGLIRRVVRRHLLPHLPEEDGCAPVASEGAPLAGGRPTRLSLPFELAATRRHPSAGERRVQISRCRTLRAEIARFEGEFRAAHGGAEPKSSSERFALAHVYDEYRRLKQAIRDDAARHVQAVFRGHRVRVAHVGTPLARAARLSAIARGRGGGAAAATGGAGGVGAGAIPPRLTSLRNEKASLKRNLRAFDASFAGASGGRAPSKAEKEHLRPAYTRYHELKIAIGAAEAALAAGDDAGVLAAVNSIPPPRPSSSSGGGAAASSAPGVARRLSMGSTTIDNSGSSSTNNSTNGGGGGDLGDSMVARSRSGSDAACSTVSEDGGGVEGGDAALRDEKKRLQVALRTFEAEFAARNGRPVRFVKDIAPARAQYARYKELKALLGGGGGGGGGVE